MPVRQKHHTNEAKKACVQPMRMKTCVPAPAVLLSVLTATSDLLQLTNGEENILNAAFSLPATTTPTNSDWFACPQHRNDINRITKQSNITHHTPRTFCFANTHVAPTARTRTPEACEERPTEPGAYAPQRCQHAILFATREQADRNVHLAERVSTCKPLTCTSKAQALQARF